jgi:excisionase family DNA binding protein
MRKNANMEPFMTSEEIAELLHVDPVTIRRLVNKGELSAYRIGADYRFAPSDLQDYLQRQRIVAHVQKEQSMNPNQLRDPFIQLFREIFQSKRIPAMTINRFDKFTEQARRVLALAQEEALRFKHNYIGTEHLLLGLIREKEGVTAQVLNNLGVELDQVRHAIETIIGQGEYIASGAIGLTPRSKKVIHLAVEEANRLHHHYVGTEHILLGLIREGQGVAAGILEHNAGLQLERVREETLRVLSQHQQSQEEETAAIPPVPPEASSLLTEGESGLSCATCGARSPRYFRYCFNCGQALTHE